MTEAYKDVSYYLNIGFTYYILYTKINDFLPQPNLSEVPKNIKTLRY